VRVWECVLRCVDLSAGGKGEKGCVVALIMNLGRSSERGTKGPAGCCSSPPPLALFLIGSYTGGGAAWEIDRDVANLMQSSSIRLIITISFALARTRSGPLFLPLILRSETPDRQATLSSPRHLIASFHPYSPIPTLDHIISILAQKNQSTKNPGKSFFCPP
jgi:hypothetical protein